MADDNRIVHFVALAEFDIDKGSCLRAQYPNVPLPRVAIENLDATTSDRSFSASDTSSWDHYLADQMLPDGAEKHSMGITYFAINRPSQFHTNARRHPVYLFMLHQAHEAAADAPPAGLASTISSLPDDSSSTSGMLRWIRNPAVPEEENEVACVDGCNVSVSYRRLQFLDCVTLQPPCEQPDEVQTFVRTHFGNLEKDDGTGDGASASPKQPAAPAADSLTNSNGFVFIIVKPSSLQEPVGLLFREAAYASFESSPSPSPSGKGLTSEVSLDQSTGFLPLVAMNSDHETIFAFNVAVTRKNAAVRRGGINKSVAILGPSVALLRPFLPLLVEAVEKCCEIQGSSEASIASQFAILQVVYDAINGLSGLVMTEAAFPATQWKVAHHCARSASQPYAVRSLSPFQLRHTIHLPLSFACDDIALNRMHYPLLLERFGSGLLQILHASIFAEKRVVIIGRQCSSTEVCEAVMAIGLIGQSIDQTFFKSKVFPYTSINNISLFNTLPGFVVGTLNPIFETQKAWWDVLCDIDAGTVVVNDACKGVIIDDAPSSEHCQEFTAGLQKEVRRLQKLVRPADSVNDFIRHSLVKYVQTIAALSSVPARQVHRSLNALREVNSKLISCFHLTGGFREFIRTFSADRCKLALFAAQLQYTQSLEDFEIMQIFQETLRQIKTTDEILDLLSFFPSVTGGIGPCAAHLLHGSFAVRLVAVALLRRLDSVPVGNLCVSRINSFLMLAYEQASKDLPDTSAAY